MRIIAKKKFRHRGKMVRPGDIIVTHRTYGNAYKRRGYATDDITAEAAQRAARIDANLAKPSGAKYQTRILVAEDSPPPRVKRKYTRRVNIAPTSEETN